MELEHKIRETQGAKIEDNMFCISVHYRQVPPQVKLLASQDSVWLTERVTIICFEGSRKLEGESEICR